jgi:hypothetical protein
MSDYTWPSDIIPQSCALSWLDASGQFVSPLSGAVRSVARAAGRWRLEMSFPPMKPAQAQKLEAFLWRLDGAAHRAVLRDFSYRRQGTGAGTPVVNGANQTGYTLATSGWTAGGTQLYAGDRIGVNGQMLVVAEDFSSAGSGTITLAHPLRSSPDDGAAIEVSNPAARFVLVSRIASSAQPGVIKQLACEFEEALV